MMSSVLRIAALFCAISTPFVGAACASPKRYTLAADRVSYFRQDGFLACNFLMFRPDGIPVGFTAACVTGQIGSGAGGVYVTNANRDYAVVVTPLLART